MISCTSDSLFVSLHFLLVVSTPGVAKRVWEIIDCQLSLAGYSEHVSRKRCGFTKVLRLLLSCPPPEEAVESYMPPFYDMVGERPTLDRMRDVVVNAKGRPHIDNSWRNDEAS